MPSSTAILSNDNNNNDKHNNKKNCRTTILRAPPPPSSCPILLSLLSLLILPLPSGTTQIFSNPFPSNDEYDFATFNPENFYGAPYGGFARATSSRLGKLPLRIIGPGFEFGADDSNNNDNDDDDDEVKKNSSEEEKSTTDGNSNNNKNKKMSFASHPHLSVSDYTGRKFSCRVYRKNELSDFSRLEEGVFALPRHVDPSSTTDRLTGATDDDNNNHDNFSISGRDLQTVFDNLNGACSQIHMGWWSYEWCFHKSFIQFHVNVESKVTDGVTVSKYTVGDVINLGKWNSNEAQVADIEEYGGDRSIVFKEKFTGGSACSEHGNKKRKSTVTIKCCEKEWDTLAKDRFRTFQNVNGRMGDYDKAILKSVTETKPCEYVAEVCTPEACLGTIQKTEQQKKKEIMDGMVSINTILKRNFERIPSGCITKDDGWWTYEYCYGKHVRQYHGETTIDPNTGKYVASITAIHRLGKHTPPTYPSTDEHLHMLNHTTPKYHVQNFTNGDVCADPDVTEASITGGQVGMAKKGGGIARSGIVRFGCGSEGGGGRGEGGGGMQLVSVQEDSTCHYVLDVSVEDLCHHRLFLEEVVEEEEQVVKCLLVT